LQAEGYRFDPDWLHKVFVILSSAPMVRVAKNLKDRYKRSYNISFLVARTFLSGKDKITQAQMPVPQKANQIHNVLKQ
jgi:hypothetical protein